MQHIWDNAGNLTQRQDLVSSETENFSYDSLDRLTTVSGAYSDSYTYDAIGNITSKNGSAYSYKTGGSTKPHAVTQIGSTSYTYDANGNMNVGTARTWDAENRLTSITKSGIETVFVYDGDGNRVAKTEGGQTTVYPNNYYEKNISTGQITTSYYLGGKLVYQEEIIDVYATGNYLIQDSLGSTAATVDFTGALNSTIHYFPFGDLRNSTGTIPTDKKFTGQRLDSTGLYYYGARYYDATVGRFISPDTVIPNMFDPQSLNRYSYCLNNPLKYTDPTGHNQQNGVDDYIGLINSTDSDRSDKLNKLLDGANQDAQRNLPMKKSSDLLKAEYLAGYISAGELISEYAAELGMFGYILGGVLLLSSIPTDSPRNNLNINPGGEATNGDPNQNPFKSKRDELLSKLPQNGNTDLRNAIEELYRPGAKIGDGGTADLIRATGDPNHVYKAMGFIKNLERIIKAGNLTPEEFEIAGKLHQDLIQSILKNGILP